MGREREEAVNAVHIKDDEGLERQATGRRSTVTESHCAGDEMEVTSWLVRSEGLGDRELSVTRTLSFQGCGMQEENGLSSEGETFHFELLH